MTVRLHRQLGMLRAIIHRFEHDAGQSSNSVLRLQTEKMAQRLNWLDAEIVELRDRSRLLQEEITLKAAEQTNRNLHVLSTVTTIFLPASLLAGIFGMNVAGLPLVQDKSGFLWAMYLGCSLGPRLLVVKALGHPSPIVAKLARPSKSVMMPSTISDKRI